LRRGPPPGLYRTGGMGHDIGMGLLQQFRCPSGLMGRLAGTAMAVTNTPLVRAVITEVAAVDGEHILDIGFGPGVSLVLLARAAPGAVVAGIDPSPVMLGMARRRTARLAGKPDLRQGTASALPWPDVSFDAVCTTNSVQLWQPLPASLSELRRVLRAAGRLVVGVHERAVLPAGGTAGRHFDETLVPALQAAGFAGIDARYRPTRGGQALVCTAHRR
jgi:arsenite methyltransferase